MPVVNFYTESDFSFSPLTFFFNSAEYVSLFLSDDVYSFYLKDSRQHVLARLHVKTSNTEASSFPYAPFGFIETVLQSAHVLETFIYSVEEYLKKRGTVILFLRSWPECYLPQGSPAILAVENAGYKRVYEDFNFHLNISSTNAIEIFKKSERKRLRKCRQNGLEFKQWISPDMSRVYSLLYFLRKQKNIPLNISRSGLEEAVRVFPDRYFVFAVTDGNNVTAISVCVEVNPEILYHFVLASDVHYNHLSPSVLMYEGIYEFCQKRNYKILDFGTASVKGVRQTGLFHFKENLGGKLSAKPYFSKQLL